MIYATMQGLYSLNSSLMTITYNSSDYTEGFVKAHACLSENDLTHCFFFFLFFSTSVTFIPFSYCICSRNKNAKCFLLYQQYQNFMFSYMYYRIKLYTTQDVETKSYNIYICTQYTLHYAWAIGHIHQPGNSSDTWQ